MENQNAPLLIRPSRIPKTKTWLFYLLIWLILSEVSKNSFGLDLGVLEGLIKRGAF